MAGPWEKYQQQENSGPWQRYQQAAPATEPQEKPAMLSDMAQGALSGLRTGLENLAGTVGDINHLTSEGISYLAGKMGASPETQATIEKYGRFLSPTGLMPTSQEINNIGNQAFGEPYQPQTIPGQYANTIGQFAPAAAVPGGIGARAANVLAPAIASETAGQLTKGVTFQGHNVEPYARILAGAAGSLAPVAASRLVTPLPISPERQAMVSTLKNEGVDLTAGQATGRKSLQYAENELGGAAAQSAYEKQGEQFTKAVLNRAGIDASRATPGVIDQGFNQIGQQFDNLAARNTLVPDTKLATDLRSTVQDYFSLVPDSQRAPVVADVVRDIASNGGKPMAGDAYQALSSRLARAERGTSDPQVKSALQGVKGALDDAMQRSIAKTNPSDLGAWQQVRNQYKNMLVIEKAATAAGENAAQGIISPSALRNATVNQSRRAYARGQGDFAQLARAGEATMKALPQSGTAPRTAVRNLGTGLSSILGAAGGASMGGTEGAMMGALAGSMAPTMAGRALLSAPLKAYLSNQLVQPQMGSPATKAAIAALLARRLPALPVSQ